ncbi:Hypothetical predicted protein [Pelobates cultripes]|uniref:Uncharacterized protein n=1 Tax=Pelobates cultripes TaxID=61616 RepID=A0AAD1S7W5_PELCU|nr:Hypothetical predicted protein [Pelobates cultripes]
MESRMMDAEDHSCQNNLRIRRVTETVSMAELPTYIHGLLKTLAPEAPPDMLLLDRVHQVPKPAFLAATVARDVLLRAHYYHIKEMILRNSKLGTDMLTEYTNVKIFTDMSVATMRRCCSFQPPLRHLRRTT